MMNNIFLVLSLIACVAFASVKSFNTVDIEHVTRIVNGHNSTRGQFPHQVLLFLHMANGGRGTCGGVLITQHHALTAAHCSVGVSLFEVNFGALITHDANEPGRVVRRTNTSIVHPYYVPQVTWNDIAIVTWNEAVQFSETINRVRMPIWGSNFYGIPAIASGFGLQQTSASTIAPILQWAQLTTISNVECYRTFGRLVARLSVICAVGGDRRESACNGDSGGPLITDDDTRTLIGLTSFGSDEGCHHGHPVVFTRVTYYLTWIRSIVNTKLSEENRI